MPRGIPKTTPAVPSTALSLSSSRHTTRLRTPTARRTPSCQDRASNTVDRRLKAIRKAATKPKRPIASSATRRDCITRWRSAWRWTGVSTRRPSGSTRAMASATRVTSASRLTTTSTPLMNPARVKSASAP